MSVFASKFENVSSKIPIIEMLNKSPLSTNHKINAFYVFWTHILYLSSLNWIFIRVIVIRNRQLNINNA